MRLLLITLLTILCTQFATHAQKLDASAYIYPIRDVARLYSANFGEIRPGHFHAGVDIKTDGVEGKPLVAVADGYISRVVISPRGYGRAIYITLKNGTTAVYGHLQRFRDDIEKHLRAERYRRQSQSLDLWFDATRFPVQQGDIVGYSGNSGSSFGPHLHFELRNTPTQRYINIVREGIIRPKDTIPPRIQRIHWVEIDTLDGVCHRTIPTPYPVVRGADGVYRLTRQDAIPVGEKGYFIAEITDRRNGVDNTFGVWRITAMADSIPYFEYRMDGFIPDHSRLCDVVSDYPLQIASRNEVIRLAHHAAAPAVFYTTMVDRGVIRTAEGQHRRIRIEAEDDCGNISSLDFEIKGVASSLHATIDSTATLIPDNRTTSPSLGQNITLNIPTGALYEPIRGHFRERDTPKITIGVVPLSPAYSLFDDATPLRKAIGVTIRCDVPRPLQLRASLASVDANGKLGYIGGTYANGYISAQTRTTATWIAVADTLPPQITPRFKQDTPLSGTALRFSVSDNFSGISSYTLLIDGEWVPCDYYPIQGVIEHRFNTPHTEKKRRAEIVITDASGNTSRWMGTFLM